MKPYKVQVPANYREIRDLGDKVHDTILARRVPQPDQVARVLGEETVKAYCLMHALMYAIEHKRGKGVPNYKRRDKKAIQRHSYDAAFKSFFRFEDRELPSKYLLTPRENIGVLVHDLGEEFGQNLVGALVVNDIVGYLLGKDAGRDADLLTNKNALLLGPLEEEVAKLEPSQINHNNIYAAFRRLHSEVRVEPRDVVWQYRRVLHALRSFKTYVENRADYMPDLQKKALIGYLDELIGGVNIRIKDGALKPDDIAELVAQQYGHVMAIMEAGKYVKVDTSLLVPEDIEFLLTLRKTLYADFVKGISEAVKSSASQSKKSTEGGTTTDSYVAPMMEKLADSTDTVANMDSKLENATSIFRKARIVIASGIDLVGHLKQSELDYRRLQRSVDYLFRNLAYRVNPHLEYLQTLSRTENTWDRDLEVFSRMKEKTDELGQRINALGEPKRFRDRIRDLGGLLGVTEINLGRVHITL